MLNVTVICVGKLKEPYLQAACGEYLKRLQSLCKCSVVELPPERLPDAPSKAEIAAALDSTARIVEETDTDIANQFRG